MTQDAKMHPFQYLPRFIIKSLMKHSQCKKSSKKFTNTLLSRVLENSIWRITQKPLRNLTTMTFRYYIHNAHEVHLETTDRLLRSRVTHLFFFLFFSAFSLCMKRTKIRDFFEKFLFIRNGPDPNLDSLFLTVKNSNNQRLGSAFDDLDPRLSLLCQVGDDVIRPCKICRARGCQIRTPRSIHSLTVDVVRNNFITKFFRKHGVFI